MAPANMFIRYNSDNDFWEFEDPIGSGSFTTLPVDGGFIVFGANDIAWAAVNKAGSSLADLATRSAGDLSSGTLADARLSSNVALLDNNENVTGAWTFDTTTLVIDTSNNRVGIGTATPDQILELFKSSGDVILRISANDASILHIDQNSIRTMTNTSISIIINDDATKRIALDTNGNMGLGTGTFGTDAVNVFCIKNGTAPSSSPADSGQLWVESGALKYRGSSGTVTTLGVA